MTSSKKPWPAPFASSPENSSNPKLFNVFLNQNCKTLRIFRGFVHLYHLASYMAGYVPAQILTFQDLKTFRDRSSWYIDIAARFLR